ncbi:hypothetical protein K4F52_003843 [Lecanicillium sp. MT-2017a]|nr:hypothetical protein K4F52_003843 [Lecanicillium sp. MT-2017a]
MSVSTVELRNPIVNEVITQSYAKGLCAPHLFRSEELSVKGNVDDSSEVLLNNRTSLIPFLRGLGTLTVLL